MKPRAISYICDLIHDKMDAAKPHLQVLMHQVTPEFIDNWDLNTIMEPLCTPVWAMILEAATETWQAKMKDKKPRSQNCIVVR